MFQIWNLKKKSFSSLDPLHNGIGYCVQVVLAMQSPALHQLLLQDPDAEILLLPDLEAATVRPLLRFLYLGQLNLGKNHIGDFLGLLEPWGIRPLVTIVPASPVAAEDPPLDQTHHQQVPYGSVHSKVFFPDLVFILDLYPACFIIENMVQRGFFRQLT